MLLGQAFWWLLQSRTANEFPTPWWAIFICGVATSGMAAFSVSENNWAFRGLVSLLLIIVLTYVGYGVKRRLSA